MSVGSPTVAVLGAGPAGLTAAYALAQAGRPAVTFEADDVVGGLARTVERDGYRFDLGGHRFFTKSEEVERIWHDVLGPDLLLRPRMSRILWNGRFIQYPLDAGDVVRKLGVRELARAGGSYIAAKLRPAPEPETFEDWVVQRFGRRLFEMFFRSYTEKVWGVPCSEIRAEWAAQRIKDLSFRTAARSALFGVPGTQIRSLIEEFHYPRLGPGQMWEAMREQAEAGGGEIRMSAPVDRIRTEGGRVVAVEAGGDELEPAAVISSLPLRTVVQVASPAAPAEVRDAARGLRYRDFLTVALVVEGEDPFPDTWVYVHDPRVRVARIQNFRAWSPWMVPEPGRACVGLEYFCFAGDELWTRPDEELVALGAAELERVGLVDRKRVVRGYVVRVPLAYPIYDADYADRVATIRTWLESLENLQQIGRNGLHRYNNSDHSMLTALRAVENLDGAGHDLWEVNADSWYHEEVASNESPYAKAPATPGMRE